MSVALFRSHVGFVRETTYGSTSALGSRYIQIQGFNPGWQDELERVVDKGIRGAPSMDFAMYTGAHKSRGGYDLYFYPDTCGIFLLGMIGGETVTGASAPFVHTFSSTDIPPSYTIYDFYGPAGASERRLNGCQLERVELNFSRASGALSVKTATVGIQSSGISETTTSYTSQTPFRGWEVTATSIFGALQTRLLEFNIVMQRKVELIWAGNNTQAPNAREIGPLEVTGKLTMYGSTFTELTSYAANSTGDVDITMTDSTNTLRLVCTNVGIENVVLDRGGVYARWDVDFRGMYNTTDSGPLRGILTVQSSCGF